MIKTDALILVIAIFMILVTVNLVQNAHIHKQQNKINYLLTIELLELHRKVK